MVVDAVISNTSPLVEKQEEPEPESSESEREEEA